MKLIEYADFRWEMPACITQHQSFEIVGVPTGDMFSVCGELEEEIERQRLKCRIYTKYRSAGLLLGGLNRNYGLLGAVFIAMHNLFTYNPDYEIARDFANNRVSVLWKKA